MEREIKLIERQKESQVKGNRLSESGQNSRFCPDKGEAKSCILCCLPGTLNFHLLDNQSFMKRVEYFY